MDNKYDQQNEEAHKRHEIEMFLDDIDDYGEEEEYDEPETDHYEETVATIEANNSSLTS